MKTREREKDSRDSILLILLILLVGFMCIIVTSGWALRFAPSWKLPANMRSNLNPDSDFLTSRPTGLYEPIDPAILTPPDWINVFLTPGSTFSTRTPQSNIPPASNTPPAAVTLTNTPLVATTTSPTNVVVAPTNTLIYFPPPVATATSTKKPKPPKPTATLTVPPTATPVLADLSITKTDNATDYAANISVTYVIVASNAGPNNVTGATVTDNFSVNLTSITWSCAGAGGASCTISGAGIINDTAVNLPVGGSVQYTVNATVIGAPAGSLANTATIKAPGGITDPNSSNDTATDTDQLITANPLPAPGGFGKVPAGTYVDYSFSTPFVVGPGSYLVYYPAYTSPSPTVNMDVVIVQLGDGKNWYTILDWGDTSASNNGDIVSAAVCSGVETDQCPIPIAGLTNSPGITVTGLPAGTYPYIRIISPPSPPDNGSGVNIDNIAVFP